MKKIFIFFLISLFHVSLHAHWIDLKAEGWAWYEDQKKEKEVPTPTSIATPSIKTAKEEIELQKQIVEEKLANAILNPTTENLLSYMAAQKQVVAQAANFSQSWVKTLINHPELDARLQEFPTSQYGIQVQKQTLQKKKEQLIQSLAKTHGLFYFYEGENPISQAFAMVVQEFQAKYNFELLAISQDHVLIQGFENNQINNGIIQNLEIKHVPSLYLVEPLQQNVIAIAFGLASMDQIENNFVIQMTSSEDPQ